jgi:predicted Zn-ribbon and HTH transcriptional regulator
MQQAEVQTPVKVREFVATEMANHCRKSLLLGSSPVESSKRREIQNQKIQAYLNAKDSQGRLELLSIIRQKIFQTDIIIIDQLNRDNQFQSSAQQASPVHGFQSPEADSPQRQERSLESAPPAPSSSATEDLEIIRAQFSLIQQEIGLLDQYFSGKLESIETPLKIQILKNAYEVYQAKQQEIAAKDQEITRLNEKLSFSEANHAQIRSQQDDLFSSRVQEIQQIAEERQNQIAGFTKQLEETAQKLSDSDRLIGELRTLNQDLAKAKADLEIQKRIDVEKLTTKTKMVENGRKIAEDLRVEVENLKAAAVVKEQGFEAQIEQLKADLKHLEEKSQSIGTPDIVAPQVDNQVTLLTDQLDKTRNSLRNDLLIHRSCSLQYMPAND